MSVSLVPAQRSYVAQLWDSVAYRVFPTTSGGGRGAKGACAPGGTVQGVAFRRRKYGILIYGRFWEFAFALQRVIFYTHNTPLVLGPQPSTVSTPWPRTKQCVHQEIYTADLTDHSISCKTVENPYCPVTVLLVIAIQCFALFTYFQILHKFENSA